MGVHASHHADIDHVAEVREVAPVRWQARVEVLLVARLNDLAQQPPLRCSGLAQKTMAARTLTI